MQFWRWRQLVDRGKSPVSTSKAHTHLVGLALDETHIFVAVVAVAGAATGATAHA